jgi:hypothetical protein
MIYRASVAAERYVALRALLASRRAIGRPYTASLAVLEVEVMRARAKFLGACGHDRSFAASILRDVRMVEV